MVECPVCGKKCKSEFAKNGHIRMSLDDDHMKYKKEHQSETEGQQTTDDDTVNTITKKEKVGGAKNTILDIIQQGTEALKSEDVLDEQKEMLKNMISELKTALAEENEKKDSQGEENERLREIIIKWQNWNRYIKAHWISPERHAELLKKEKETAFEAGKKELVPMFTSQRGRIQQLENSVRDLNRIIADQSVKIRSFQDGIERLARLRRKSTGMSIRRKGIDADRLQLQP